MSDDVRKELIEVIDETMRKHQWHPDITQYVADAILKRWPCMRTEHEYGYEVNAPYKQFCIHCNIRTGKELGANAADE